MMLTATKKADDLGNRENVNVRDGNDITYAVDNLTNRYTSVAEANLTYNAAGSLTKDRQGYEYEYDYENRIVKITKAGQTKAEFAYDALGRRIEKKDLVDPNNTRRYYYNYNWQALCQYDGGGALKETFVYGNYIDEVLFKVPLFYMHDHLYSPVALVHWLGSVLERYEYDAYGNCYVLEPNFAPDPDGKSDYGNPYLFTGRGVDILDSGNLQIMYYRARYYDPWTGRFLSHDSLSYKVGMNLYEYARSNPIIFEDPYGREPVTILVCGGAVTLTAAEAAAAAFGVSVAVCYVIPECKALILDPAADAVADLIKSTATTAKKLCKIRCNFKWEPPHHWWWRPRLGIPPWKKCYMKHIRVTCWFKGTPGSKWIDFQMPYGPCYKFPGGAGGITH